uniref:Endothelial PAS domain protein 1b n=1 Tax=Eptatretus burgeri TaxID=7764 RepID=A0A8C4QW92_EPTBU
MTVEKDKKRGTSERRKEKSRDAARYRRSKETQVFSQLAQELPITHGLSASLDKASVMRMAISYLRTHGLLPTGSSQMRGEATTDIDFLMRMKCTLTSRGRMVNLKSASWKVLHCTGHVKHMASVSCGSSPIPPACLVLLCRHIPHPTDELEPPQDGNSFLSRHSMDMKFLYCDDRVKDSIGYSGEELVGRSLYECCHALDSDHLLKSHHGLFSKGQVQTGRYRLLARHGGFVWVQSQATIMYNSHNAQPQSIVCINVVLSGVEHNDFLFSLEQTEQLFKGRLVQSGNDPRLVEDSAHLFTLLKEKPDELAQLAPTAGDTIVPLHFGDAVHQMEPVISGSDFKRKFHQEGHMGADHKYLPSSFAVPQLGGTLNSPCSTESISCPSSPGDNTISGEPRVDLVEKLFATNISDSNCIREKFAGIDLEMVAPYIPMDGEDFQLCTLNLQDQGAPPSLQHLPAPSPCVYPRTFLQPNTTFDRNCSVHDQSPVEDLSSSFDSKPPWQGTLPFSPSYCNMKLLEDSHAAKVADHAIVRHRGHLLPWCEESEGNHSGKTDQVVPPFPPLRISNSQYLRCSPTKDACASPQPFSPSHLKRRWERNYLHCKHACMDPADEGSFAPTSPQRWKCSRLDKCAVYAAVQREKSLSVGSLADCSSNFPKHWSIPGCHPLKPGGITKSLPYLTMMVKVSPSEEKTDCGPSTRSASEDIFLLKIFNGLLQGQRYFTHFYQEILAVSYVSNEHCYLILLKRNLILFGDVRLCCNSRHVH